MNKTTKLQNIKLYLMENNDLSNDEAVKMIADMVSRSPRTVYEWLSNNRPNIPNQVLELLELKLTASCASFVC